MLAGRILIICLQLLALLPLGWSRALGRLVGGICWAVKTRMAQTTRKNLDLCLPELTTSERDRLGRRSLMETFATIAESAAVWLWPSAKILNRIQGIQSLEILKKAHEEGRGVIVIAPHLGNWELVGLFLNACEIGQTIQLFQAPKNATIARMIFRARSRIGATMVPTDGKGVARLLAGLRDGKVVGMLPDQVPPPETGGEFVSFFGVPALTMTLLSRLLHKTGARAVMMYAKRVRTDRGEGFEMIIREPDETIYHEDMAISLTGLNHSIELLAREALQQYQWEYKRFKRQPEGYQRPY